jgi:SAM-dependent methyltransferase
MLAGRRAKWEEFWAAQSVAAEATHRRSVELILDLLHRENIPPLPLGGQSAARSGGEGTAPPLPLGEGRGEGGGRLLDLGCGSGRVVELLGQAGYRVVGFDLSSRALQAARRRLGPRAGLVQGDAFALPFAPASFEAIVSLGYASVGSYPGAQAELARVLRRGGLALIDFRYLGAYHLPLLALRGRRLLGAWRQGEVALPVLGLRPPPAWQAAGLRLERLLPFNTFPPLEPWLGPRPCLAFEHSIGRHLSGLLGRVVLAQFRLRR